MIQNCQVVSKDSSIDRPLVVDVVADPKRRQLVLTNKISVLEVEAVQLIASLFCVGDIFVNHKGRSSRVVCEALANLTIPSVSMLLEVKVTAIDLPNGPEFAEKIEELFRCDVVAVRMTCQVLIVQVAQYGNKRTLRERRFVDIAVARSVMAGGEAYLRFLTKRILEVGGILSV